MAVSHQNNRASLLAALRTGGVRSSSNNAPHTAAPGATFNFPRFPSHSEEIEYNSEPQDVYVPNRIRNGPLTSAVDGSRFSYQQNAPSQINPAAMPFTPSVNVQQAQSLQIQMMQMEILRLQVSFPFTAQTFFSDLLIHRSIYQAQQYQTELLAQAQLQQQQQQQQQQIQQTHNWRAPSNPPATAGPRDLRFAAAMNNQMRGNRAESLRSKLGVYEEPMTAALDGRFGSRKVYEDEGQELTASLPSTPSRTTVISGGTVLGSPLSNNMNTSPSTGPSKSDSATSWRRGPNNSALRTTSMTTPPPSVKITPPPGEGPAESVSPSPSGNIKLRPQPLRFNIAVSQPLPVIAIDSSEVDADDASSSGSSRSGGSPRTPSSYDIPPLSPREEATKRLYEGLGIGRPVPSPSVAAIPQPQQTAPIRVLSQPMRQPKGPPSGADELGPKNFATRIRRKAIGGLSGLLETRERRDIEVY